MGFKNQRKKDRQIIPMFVLTHDQDMGFIDSGFYINEGKWSNEAEIFQVELKNKLSTTHGRI